MALLAGPAAATPLDEESCKKLQTERQGLAVLGVDKNLEKGADWAKANLKAADINLVKRYLELYEQLKFRCEKVIALIEPDEPDDEAEDGVAKKNGPPAPERKDASPEKSSSIEQIAPAKENAAEPVSTSASIAGKTVSAKESKGDKQQVGPSKASAVSVSPARIPPTNR
ncbi:MAG TPA: hypothetical protein VH858_01740 [Hyphomicrobiales bacterium]|jgi:hypothetical protein